MHIEMPFFLDREFSLCCLDTMHTIPIQLSLWNWFLYIWHIVLVSTYIARLWGGYRSNCQCTTHVVSVYVLSYSRVSALLNRWSWLSLLDGWYCPSDSSGPYLHTQRLGGKPCKTELHNMQWYIQLSSCDILVNHLVLEFRLTCIKWFV